MTFLLFAIIHFSAAQESQAPADPKALCLEYVKGTIAVLTKSKAQCRWRLPDSDITAKPPEKPVGYCSAWDRDDNGKWVKKKSTYDGAEHEGVLDCENSDHAIATSYKDNKPMFVFQCMKCATSNDQPTLDDMCLKSISETLIKNCENERTTKMNRDPKTGLLIDSDGKLIKDTELEEDKPRQPLK